MIGSGDGIQRRSLLRAVGATAFMLAAGRAWATPQGADWQAIERSGAGLLTMPVRVGDRTVRAAIDSASSGTVIDASLTAQLGLEPRGEASATGLSGPIRGSRVRVPVLRLGQLSFEDVDAQSYDLSALAMPKAVQLFIGQDLLSRCLLELQFSRLRFRLGKREEERAPSGLITLDLTRSLRRLPLVRTSIEGGPETTGIFDLGSTIACSVSRRWAEDKGLIRDRRVSTALTVGAEGATENLILTARSVTLGPYILREVPVCVIDDWQRSSQVDLGLPFFQAFDMLLDLGRDRLTLGTDQQRLARPLPKDRAGIGASRMGDRYLVSHVAKGSPAEHAGLRPGDEIVAFNGRPVDTIWPPPTERQGLKAAGTRLRIALADGRHVELILADYF